MQEKMLPWFRLFFYRVKLFSFGAVLQFKKLIALFNLSRFDSYVDGLIQVFLLLINLTDKTVKL